jgi:hypothetical protein
MNDLKVIKGAEPILFTAPHAVKHHRLLVDKYWRVAEEHTAEIAQKLALAMNAFALFPMSDLQYDPNTDVERNNPFKKEIRRLVSEYNIKYVIDIHGLHEKYNYDFAIFYTVRYGKSKRLAECLAGKLNDGVLKNSLTHIFSTPKIGMNCPIYEFVAVELGTSAVQVEVAQYIRNDNDLINELQFTM